MMNFTGKVNRTFAVQGIPAGRVGAAEKLGLQADLPGRRRHRQTDYGSRRLPGCPTGCATDDANTGNEPAVHLHLKFRGSEQLAIGTQTLLPGQTTSGGRADLYTGHQVRVATGDSPFFTGQTGYMKT